MRIIRAQAAVVGIGSAGFGCAYTLVKNGIRTVLIEKNGVFGGTSVAAGVNCWEPGVCDGELHWILAERLRKIPQACAVCKTVPNGSLLGDPVQDMKKYPWGFSVPDDGATYRDTLKRCRSLTGGREYRRFQFEPDCMSRVMRELIAEYASDAIVLLNTEYTSCKVEGRRIRSIDVKNRDGTTRIYADYFVDCSGDIALARDAGCKTEIGSAEDPTDVNGVSFVFRIRKKREKQCVNTSGTAQTVSCFNAYPNGEINVNMLPTIKGSDYLKLGDDAEQEGRKRVHDYFAWLQKEKGLDHFELVHIFPQPGIREGYRLVGKYVLTGEDVLSGRQDYPCGIAALADHALDIHDGKSRCVELETPYAIPMDCLFPNEIDHLMVACRGASFSHEAASSARLSRTMLTLGERAGSYLVKKIKKRKDWNDHV